MADGAQNHKGESPSQMRDQSQEIKSGRGGIRQGAGRPKGSTSSRSRTQQERDSLAAMRIEQILDQAREGKLQLSTDRLKAMELRYARLRPVLSAVEQTNIDPRDKKDPALLVQSLSAMFDQKPELWDQLLKIRGAAATNRSAADESTGSTAAAAHVTH